MELLGRYAGWPVIVGAGLAGLSAALHLARPCVLLSPDPLGENTASALAQGGLAAALAATDSPEQHAQDTLAAGAGLCDPAVVRAITTAAPGVVHALEAWGLRFDRNAAGDLDLHLEAAHRQPRVVHAAGDGSGAAILHCLIARLRATSRIVVLQGQRLTALEQRNGQILGVWMDKCFIPTHTCVIASGGVGGLYVATTSPAGNRGSALSLAARAGAVLADMEFVQFHPTALDLGPSLAQRQPLISEAVRGAGAILIDETGARFTSELAPRDVVARAIARHQNLGHRVFLDARNALGARFAQHFPAIDAACRAAGIDPTHQPIPVRPATHYHMGGIAVDRNGRSSILGLWACGEAACTGLHGANRLASNSLLEAFVCGRTVAHDIEAQSATPRSVPAKLAPPLRLQTRDIAPLLSQHAGLLRHEAGLTVLREHCLGLADTDHHALVGALIAHAALERRESRGSHAREDYPDLIAPVRRRLTLADLPWPEARSKECV